MDPSLYSTTMQLKRKMTLDLQSDSNLIKKSKSSLHTPCELLQSPDLQLLGLGTPEIERFILQQNLPTPNLSNVFFPKSVTEEQEHYVKGFSDALDRLKQQNQLNSSSPSPGMKYEHSTTTGSNSSSASADDNSLLSEDQNSNSNFYESDSVPSAPINMENQEKAKLERKRQRNRIAASKCRRRKLEKIGKLEDKVKQLKGENAELSAVMNKLKENVLNLRDQIMRHVNSGCQIMIQSNSVTPSTGFA